MNKKQLTPQQEAEMYFKALFYKADLNKHGGFELRQFHKDGGPPVRKECSSINEAVSEVLLNRDEYNIFTTINLGIGGHKKENIEYLSTFHVDIDYGNIGHKKGGDYDNYEQAFSTIEQIELTPTIIVHSGGGFHCYWVLQEPIPVSKYGVEELERINSGIITLLHGDQGTKDITRILRVPGSKNFKNTDEISYRECTLLSTRNAFYEVSLLQEWTKDCIPTNPKTKKQKKDNKQKKSPQIDIPTLEPNYPAKASETTPEPKADTNDNNYVNINHIGISQRTRKMINEGINHYDQNESISRSEFDLCVILGLVQNNIDDEIIKSIFQHYPVGEKYREHNDPDAYLNKTISKAKKLIGLTYEQSQDPLFLSGSIKIVKEKLFLDITNFQIYVCNKYKIVYSTAHDQFFYFDGIYYKKLTPAEINNLCQMELGENYRYLFKQSQLKEFLHFAQGSHLISEERYNTDKKRYLTFENYIFDYKTRKILHHSPHIFSTMKIPYSYDAKAKCPRWLRFLSEIFSGDQSKIDLVQEMVGYIFYPEIPTPALFFLVGSGANGKSVFLNTIKCLAGASNTASITLHKLCDDKYVTGLDGKLANISMETPSKKLMEMDTIKAITSGDPISARKLYSEVKQYTFFAKHFLAMNTFPEIGDNTLGMRRRIYLVEFNRTFSKEDADVYLDKKLQKELSGILNWCFMGLKRLKENNFQFSVTEEILKTRDDYLSESNIISSFMKNAFSKVNDSKLQIQFKLIYEKYFSECLASKIEPVSKKIFIRHITNEGYKVKKSTLHSNKTCVIGIIEN